MKIRLFFLVAVLFLALITGLVSAQGPDSPETVVQTLVDDGYVFSAEGSLSAENPNDEVSSIGNVRELVWKASLGDGSYSFFVIGSTIAWGPGQDEDACGFIFRQQDDDHFYVVRIDREGALRFEEKSGSILPAETVRTDAIRQDSAATNDLWLVGQEDHFDVFINGEHIAQFTDSSYESGSVGLALNTLGRSSATLCTFTNSWVWKIEPPATGLFGGTAPQPTATPRPTATPLPPAAPTLADYDKPINEAVAELERLELIPAGGSEIFREPYAYFEGTGSWFTPLASFRPHTQVIVAGTLTFHTGDTEEFEACTLLSRIIEGDRVTDTYLEVGLTNNGDVFAYDVVNGEQYALDGVPLGVDLGEPHHILYMAFRDKLTVYLDGDPVITDLEVQERAGTYGIALMGVGANARCEGRDLWAWEVDDVVAFGDQCGVRAANTVNLRSGPGTEFDLAGSLTGGQTAIIVGQATGSDGFTWWKLESGNWVRSDVITAGGNCADVPVVEP